MFHPIWTRTAIPNDHISCTNTGEYKVILQLVGLLSHGKLAKQLADSVIDRMDAVQNLRRAVFECVVFLSTHPFPFPSSPPFSTHALHNLNTTDNLV